jgi:glycosyltransferase involved in cell wall biosynthesis
VRVLLDVSAVPDRPVGAGVYTTAIARGIDARDDLELHVLARRNDAGRWEALTPSAVVHAVVPNRRPARLLWEQAGAPRLMHAVRPDVWHGPHYTLPLRASAPTVVTVHDMTFFDHPEWHERAKVAYFRRMIRAAVARADIVICVSDFTATRLHANCNVRGEVIVIPHGVDHQRFSPADPETTPAELATLARHGIAPPYIAFSGTIEPRKNVPAIVAAFASVARSHPDLRLVLAGSDGWGAAATRAAIATSGESTRVLRPGYLANETVAMLFRHATAVAYPSFEEGFGLPALEAMACATPLVTARGSALEEVVGDAALVVSPGNVEELASAFSSVLDDSAAAAKLRAAGPARAAEFTWRASIARHIDAYRHAVPAATAS